MKSQAERQKAVRERRKASGEHRRLNMWISLEAFEALTQLAHARQLTRMQCLDALLKQSVQAAQPSAVVSTQSPSTESEENSPPQTKAARPAKKTAGSRKKASKKKTQVQLDLLGRESSVAAPTPPAPSPVQTSLWDE